MAEEAKRGRGRPSTRGKDGLTKAERDIQAEVVIELQMASAEGRRPVTDQVRKALRGRGWGSVSRTRVMDQVRALGLAKVWTTRGEMLEKYIRRYCPPGKTWSQHITDLHRDQRLRLQRAALEHPDQAELALDEDNDGLRLILQNSGLQAPVYAHCARATLERSIRKRSKAKTYMDKQKARFRERLAERKAEHEAMEAWRKATGSQAYSPSEDRHDLEQAWKEHKAATRGKKQQELRTDDSGHIYDRLGNRMPPQPDNRFDAEHAIRRQREGW